MARFKVQHRYAANHNGHWFGPWEADEEIDLDAPDAEWVLRDSPGALEPVKPKVEAKAAKPNRQHASAQNRDA